MIAQRAALRRLRRSIALATGQIERAGRHGRSVGPYVCATVELRVEDLRDVLAMAEDTQRRAKLAVRYLRCVSSGQFVTASLVVAAIRTLEGEPLPLVARGGKRAKR